MHAGCRLGARQKGGSRGWCTRPQDSALKSRRSGKTRKEEPGALPRLPSIRARQLPNMLDARACAQRQVLAAPDPSRAPETSRIIHPAGLLEWEWRRVEITREHLASPGEDPKRFATSLGGPRWHLGGETSSRIRANTADVTAERTNHTALHSERTGRRGRISIAFTWLSPLRPSAAQQPDR